MFYFSQYFFIILFAVNLKAQSYLVKQPDYLKSCEIKKPGFAKCSTENFQGIFDNIISRRLPNLESVKSFDPFIVDKVTLIQQNSDAVNVQIDLAQVKLYGFNNTIVKENRINQKDYSWITKLLIPMLRIESNYNMKGRMLVIPVNGKGKAQLDIENMEVILYADTKLYQKGDFIFDGLTGVKVDYKLDGLHMNFTNLFNGNRELEESTNQVFNENWPVIADALKPVVKKTIEDILFEILRKAFDYIPANFFVSDIDIPKSS